MSRLSQGDLASHPGVAAIREHLLKNQEGVFAQLWRALGGSVDPLALRRALHSHAKFGRRHVWIVVPVYSDDPDAWVLHSFMELLVEASMAQSRLCRRRVHPEDALHERLATRED